MTPSQASASPSTSTVDKRPKRKRVSRACDQCFLKKDRCDGLQPICTFCSQLQRTCTYDRPERKRGPTQGLRPRLEQRIAALETVLGFVLAQTGEEGLRADQLKKASEEEKSRWRKDGWWKSGIRKQLEREYGLKEDLVTSGAAIVKAEGSELKPSPSALSTEKEMEDDEASGSDYSEVDLSLPPTHKPPNRSVSSNSNVRASSPHNHDATSNDHDSDDDSADAAHHFNNMPLLSSGVGGSSLNRGLVPRGTDPNAALGGFNIEFGGNQTDIDWVESFVPPSHSRSRREAGQRYSSGREGSEHNESPR